MSYFSSVVGDSVVFSYNFFVSLAFLVSFFGNEKKKSDFKRNRYLKLKNNI